MRVDKVADPVYAPNSKGGPIVAPGCSHEENTWPTSGEILRAPYSMRSDDDDFIQAGSLVRHVMNDQQRAMLVSNVVGHLKKGVTDPVLQRVFRYWRAIDQETGDRIAKAMQNS